MLFDVDETRTVSLLVHQLKCFRSTLKFEGMCKLQQLQCRYITSLALGSCAQIHFGVKVENAPAKCNWQTGSEGTDNDRSCTQR